MNPAPHTGQSPHRGGFTRRLLALSKKESLQILRDPSSNIIAFVLPVIMLFIFGYGINLDTAGLRVGLVLEDSGPEARRFADSLFGSPYLRVTAARDRAQMAQALVEGGVRGFVVVPEDFSEQLKRPRVTAPLLVVTDGAEPNTANFVENYVRQAWNGWLQQRSAARREASEDPGPRRPRRKRSPWNRDSGSTRPPRAGTT